MPAPQAQKLELPMLPIISQFRPKLRFDPPIRVNVELYAAGWGEDAGSPGFHVGFPECPPVVKIFKTPVSFEVLHLPHLGR